jgi:hypothetical protein
MSTLLPLPSHPITTASPSRRRALRTLIGGALLLGAASTGLYFALRRRIRDELVFVVRPPRSSPLRLRSGELRSVDWPRQVWHWPRERLDEYWSDPNFFPAGAPFAVEFRGAELFRGRVAAAVDARAPAVITLRVLQLRSGPGPSPLLAGDLGFAFALADAAGRPAFPCADPRVVEEVRRRVDSR